MRKPSRVIAFGAHPDDVELGAGGFLSRLARAQTRVVVGVVSVPSDTGTRLAEAREAAQLLGVELFDLSRGEPKRVEDHPMHELVALLDELVEAVRPDLVLTHSKDDVHWDHGLVHHATIAALRRTPCDLLTFTSTQKLNAASTFLSQCFVDISNNIETKLAALRAHASQVARGSVDVEASRDLARALGRLCGAEYAEAFQVMRLTL
jgi:LmbE family N-acetylglucosaminyl deacetylase